MADESEAMAMMVDASEEPSSSSLFDYAMASSYNSAATAAAAASTNAAAATALALGSGADNPTQVPTPTTAEAVSDPLAGSAAATAAAAATTTTAMTTSASMSGGGGGGATTTALFNHELDAELALPDKKTGRPSHPAWEHFVRGSKRNRFHHHAYCKYCSAHGAEPEPVRGVSGNMIRHLQKCIYCPEEIVLQLRVLCAQKDAVNYNKRHHHQSAQPPLAVDLVGGMIQASAAAAAAAEGAATKKLKRSLDSIGSTSGAHSVPPTAAADAFVPLSMPAVASAAARGAAGAGGKSSSNGARSKASRGAAAAASTRLALTAPPTTPLTQPLVINQAALNRLVLRATLSSGIPLDWMSMEESSRLSAPAAAQQPSSVALPLRVAVYSKELVSSLSSGTYETLIQRHKEEAGGDSTLTINFWFNKAERTNLMLFSLVNAHGEATAWKLVDVGTEDVALEELATQIKSAVVALADEGVQLVAIVSDNLLAYAAAKAAIASGGDPHPPIAVLPSFEAFLVNAMGVILTISESHVETMGQVIELVAAFSNARLRDTLRRECGDPDAALVLPSKDKWFSFIDCIDSLRQFEDMIKIIGLRVVIHQSEAAAMQRGEEAEPTPASKATGLSGGSVLDVPAQVLETIQNPQFWENVVSLSELMSPIKETYKVMLSHNSSPMHATAAATSVPNCQRNTSSAIMSFSLSDVFYQLGRMYQQYTAIIADWEENPSASRAVSHVRYLQEQVTKTWKLYDLPLMFLAYTLNYNMAPPLLARNVPALQWLSIGKYAKEYFRRWFCATAAGQRAATSTSRGSTLNEEVSTQFLEDVLAFKERKYPFDAESVCDFENPRAFYQLISDSNPLMHLFGTRLFSFATSVPQLARVVPGKSSVTRVATSVCSQELLFPLIQVNLRGRTSSRHQTTKDFLTSLQQPARGARKRANSDTGLVLAEGSKELPCGSSVGTARLFGASAGHSSGIWNDREWRLLAKQWKVEWEHEGNVGNVLDSVAGLNSTSGVVSSRLQVELLSLDQIFKEKLPSRLQQSREEEAVVDV